MRHSRQLLPCDRVIGAEGAQAAVEFVGPLIHRHDDSRGRINRKDGRVRMREARIGEPAGKSAGRERVHRSVLDLTKRHLTGVKPMAVAAFEQWATETEPGRVVSEASSARTA